MVERAGRAEQLNNAQGHGGIAKVTEVEDTIDAYRNVLRLLNSTIQSNGILVYMISLIPYQFNMPINAAHSSSGHGCFSPSFCSIAILFLITNNKNVYCFILPHHTISCHILTAAAAAAKTTPMYHAQHPLTGMQLCVYQIA